MARIKRPLAPRPPRELCSSWTNYLLGIVSPALYIRARHQETRTPKVEKYLRRLEAYHDAVTRKRIRRNEKERRKTNGRR